MMILLILVHIDLLSDKLNVQYTNELFYLIDCVEVLHPVMHAIAAI